FDLIAATIGRDGDGELLYLENQTTDRNKPRFAPHVLERHPADFDVPVVPIMRNVGMGNDVSAFIALLHQERETVALFYGNRQGQFVKKILQSMPRTGSGSIGFAPSQSPGGHYAGKCHILFTNGVAFDHPYVPKLDHGVRWLEPMGGWSHRE